MEVRPVTEEELPLAAALAAERQAEPEHHICYLSMTPEHIAGELRGLQPHGLAGVLVAVDGDRLLGLIGCEHDDEPPRAWWWGPFVFDRAEDPVKVADALLAAGRRLLPAHVTQEELGPDSRNRLVAALADRHGFTAEQPSVVLRRPARTPAERAAATGAAHVMPLQDQDRGAVAALHDAAFPGTHTPGHRVDEGDRRVVLVAHHKDQVAGYVAAEAQEDGGGYIDYLAVAPWAQGAGIGAALVEAAGAALEQRHGCATLNLTVRESNAGARALYAKLGFTEERLIRPWRRGFSLEGGGVD